MSQYLFAIGLEIDAFSASDFPLKAESRLLLNFRAAHQELQLGPVAAVGRGSALHVRRRGDPRVPVGRLSLRLQDALPL